MPIFFVSTLTRLLEDQALAVQHSVARSDPGFRRDINGLRAWAVLSVVLYHFAVAGVSGGFVGVDIFFVISGFLMAGIVHRGLEAKSFSLLGFYLARARRIWPVLLLVVLVVMALGWLLLLPSEYQVLGKHARDTLYFSSNLRYLKESGYFDVASQQKWLLHTWSLSVEWQFYLIYPLVLVCLDKLAAGRRPALVVHMLAALGSFAFCVVLTGKNSEAAFFLLPSRAWEMLVGGLVFLLTVDRASAPQRPRLIEGMGFGLIIASVLLIDTQMAWPGYLALLPTFGTCLVLWAARQQSRWTGSRAAQWLGTRSYSVYLWHWPLVVLLAYCNVQHEPLWVVTGILASLVLGHLSYVAVEVPVGRWLGRRYKIVAALLLIVSAVLLTHVAQWIRNTGVPERLSDQVVRIDAASADLNPRKGECLNEGAPCVYGGTDIAALVIGDSHADALITAVQASLPDAQQGVYFRGQAGCLMVEGSHKAQVGKEGDRCWAFKRELFAQLDTLYVGKPLIVINRTSGYALGSVGEHGSREGLPQVYFSAPADAVTAQFKALFREHYLSSVCRLAQQHPVYLMRPLPEMPGNVPQLTGHALMWGREVRPSITREQYRQRHGFVWGLQDEAAAQCGVKILDPLPYLCDEQKCDGTRDGLPLYIDDNHLNERGNRLLIPMFKQVFDAPQAGDAGAGGLAH